MLFFKETWQKQAMEGPLLPVHEKYKLKFIPGIGSTLGAVIDAGVAGTITTTFGFAYIATLQALTKDDPGRIPLPEGIKGRIATSAHSIEAGNESITFAKSLYSEPPLRSISIGYEIA